MKAELAGGSAGQQQAIEGGAKDGDGTAGAGQSPAAEFDKQVDLGEGGVMIVRIMGEGQVRLADSHFAELNKLDDDTARRDGER